MRDDLDGSRNVRPRLDSGEHEPQSEPSALMHKLPELQMHRDTPQREVGCEQLNDHNPEYLHTIPRGIRQLAVVHQHLVAHQHLAIT